MIMKQPQTGLFHQRLSHGHFSHGTIAHQKHQLHIPHTFLSHFLLPIIAHLT
jgi:hypothetical protein